MLARIHDWRARSGNHGRIKPEPFAQIMRLIGEAGVSRSVTGFVVLGTEWMFRLRDTGPQDTEALLAGVERQLAKFLEPDAAWAMTEALAAPMRKLLKSHRMLATELEPDPTLFGGDEITIEAPRQPRTPPARLIPVRRGPAPRPAPWIAGIIIERLLIARQTERSGEARRGKLSRPRILALDLTSVLCGHQVDEKDYRVRRRSLEGAALDRLINDFEEFDRVLGSLDLPAGRQWPRDWFLVLAEKLQFAGLRNTFPYYLPSVIELVTAYRTSIPKKAAKKPAEDTS